MEKILSDLKNWFAQRPLWLQDAASKLIQKGILDDNELAELISLCKKEAGLSDPNAQDIQPQAIPDGAFEFKEAPITLRLQEISNVRGINALSPRKPLVFDEVPLTIIYGGTGSGKSGYVRILKHACGAKKTGELHGNVFDQSDSDKGCTFKLKIGEENPIKLDWSPDLGVLGEIRGVEIYDTECAHTYLTEENEVAYEPWVLSFFTHLTGICTHVNQSLKNEIDRSSSFLSFLPAQFQGVASASWYSNLNSRITQQEIDGRCYWNQNIEDTLAEITRRLAEPDPAGQAKRLRNIKANVLTLHVELNKIRDKLIDGKCSAYLNTQNDAISKRKATDEDAKKVFENAPLDGVGSQSWRLLWEQARAYSEAMAYKDAVFPNIAERARCVLCHELLPPEARERFVSFEEFVKGELQRQANEAERQFKSTKDDLEEILSVKELALRMDSAGITADAERNKISIFHSTIVERKNSLLIAKYLADVSALPDADLLKRLEERCDNLEKQAQALDEDAKGQNRVKLQNRAKDLETRKWLSEQKNIIEKEVARLKHIDKLEEARRKANSRDLSIKKSALADVLISPAFIKRFKNELKSLGASHIHVELIKTRADHGRVYHKIRLVNCVNNVCTTDILSEGEFRIVSLATFLADVEDHAHNTPFIFDDPISSLDQDFEEAAARRLIALCGSRQVIVFTHRLSLLALLEEAAKSADVEPRVICLRSESWGTGEPGETPIFAKKPQSALNSIKNERLSNARKVLEEDGRSEYEPIAKSICSDIRILIERLIENDLLADVVQRFRRSVQTMGKLHKLANINADDCKLLDGFMTKYSRYEHSQPAEAPVPIPDPDEIENDLKAIIEWLNDFNNR